MAEWKKLAEIDNSNIAAFKTLIKEGQCHNR